mgnify:CR=1 FL=1
MTESRSVPPSDKFVAIFTLSAQVTEDSYKVFQHPLECGPGTTLAEIFKWKDAFGRGCTPISLTLERLEQLP